MLTTRSDWFGKAHFQQPTPASLEELKVFFPELKESNSVTPHPQGESIAALHNRMTNALSHVIAESEAVLASSSPESIMISCHAAPIIAAGRSLTGMLPQDPSEPDFDTHTCGISKFVKFAESTSMPLKPGKLEANRQSDWKMNVKVVGGWRCELNSSVEHLPNGGERNW